MGKILMCFRFLKKEHNVKEVIKNREVEIKINTPRFKIQERLEFFSRHNLISYMDIIERGPGMKPITLKIERKV